MTAVTTSRRSCQIDGGWRLRSACLQRSVRELRPSRRDRCRPDLTGRLQTADLKRPDEEQGGRLPRKRRMTVPWPRWGRRGLRRHSRAFSTAAEVRTAVRDYVVD